MLGLRRNNVQVVEHNSEWAGIAARACADIREAAGELIIDVQHVGSTSVQGLPAKPILDIVAAADSQKVIPLLVARLTATGYIFCGDHTDEGGHLFIWESEPDIRTIHLHVVTSEDVQWRNYLAFRDVLRERVDLRKQYAELKRGLETRYPNDRKSYTNSKRDFIRSVLEGEARHRSG